MLIRQKIVLALIDQVPQPINPTALVKLVFLLRHETSIAARHPFYDFVPYRYGPFSFSLYRELVGLRRDGYISVSRGAVSMVTGTLHLSRAKAAELPQAIREAISQVARRYGQVPQQALLVDVYRRYPWYATRSQLTDYLPPDVLPQVAPARPAVYTIGYEKRSIDSFFDTLLRAGIQAVMDVRANPVSRSYGFMGPALERVSHRLGLDYRHIPELGIPSEARKGLEYGVSRQQLLDHYEQHTLPREAARVKRVAEAMTRQATILVCLEADPQTCHRSRLAAAVSEASGLPVVHL